MPERGSHGQGALAVDNGAVHLACQPAIEAHGGIDRPEPPLVAQHLAEGLGPAQVIEHPPRGFAQGIERACMPSWRSIACSVTARLSGRCAEATSACSKAVNASR